MSFIIPNIILTEVRNKGRIFPCDTFNIILKKKNRWPYWWFLSYRWAYNLTVENSSQIGIWKKIDFSLKRKKKRAKLLGWWDGPIKRSLALVEGATSVSKHRHGTRKLSVTPVQNKLTPSFDVCGTRHVPCKWTWLQKNYPYAYMHSYIYIKHMNTYNIIFNNYITYNIL